MSESSIVKRSITVRLVIIVILSLLLLIPTAMIMGIIKERSHRYEDAVSEISSKWGRDQTLVGPILNIPYEVITKTEKNEIEKHIRYIHLLPESLIVCGEMQPEIRYRGIYKAILFNTKLNYEGTFNLQELQNSDIDISALKWKESNISYGISDLRGIREGVTFNLNNKLYACMPGLSNQDIFDTGISANIDITRETQDIIYKFDINVNGSGELNFIPVGKTTKIDLKSQWNTPSFIGEFLPESREVDGNGFTASWKVLHYNRNYPQAWNGKAFDINKSEFGVKLIFPVDEYQKNIRVTKYAIMFIGLTFLAFFIIEVFSGKVLHPIQYILIGLALVLFYSLLLSFSEYISFPIAYIIASLVIIILVALYTKGIFKSTRHALIITLVLVLLYAFLFVIVQLQDYSLLVGSVGLLAILAYVMYLTRHVDWFTKLKEE